MNKQTGIKHYELSMHVSPKWKKYSSRILNYYRIKLKTSSTLFFITYYYSQALPFFLCWPLGKSQLHNLVRWFVLIVHPFNRVLNNNYRFQVKIQTLCLLNFFEQPFRQLGEMILCKIFNQNQIWRQVTSSSTCNKGAHNKI